MSIPEYDQPRLVSNYYQSKNCVSFYFGIVKTQENFQKLMSPTVPDGKYLLQASLHLGFPPPGDAPVNVNPASRHTHTAHEI